MQLLIALNPESDSSLPYLIRVPVGEGMVFRTKGTWPRTAALFCFPVPLSEWPGEPEIVEQIPLRACVRRGAAIDVVADRAREHRSQIVFTRGRGREMVFWQSPKTRKQARPNVSVSTARAGGLADDLQIIVDAHERYAYRFATQPVQLSQRALACGDYAVEVAGSVWACVERKSLSDLVSSLTGGRLRYAMAELASLPRAAVVIENRYSEIFKQDWARPSLVVDGLAELQVRFPSVPIVFCETRKLAEDWTYRFLSAAYVWSGDSSAAVPTGDEPEPQPPAPPMAEVRAWARTVGIPVPDRGRLRPEVVRAWQVAHDLAE